MRPARLLRGGPVRIRSCRSVFTAAGPLRCASGPGDPQSLSLDCVPLSTCPALGAGDPQSLSLDYVPLSTCPALGAGDPQSLSLDCVPLSTCPALGASATRSPLRLIASRFRPARLSERWRAAAIGGEGPQLFTEFAALRWLRPRTASPIRFPRPRAVHLPPENRSRWPPPPATAAHPFFSTNHGNRSPPARPIFAVSGPAVRRPLSGKQSLGRPLPAAARRIVGRNYCRRHSRPPASSLRRPAGIFPKPTSRIAPLAALADGSQASQAPATVTSALSEVRLKKPPRSIGRAPRRFPENSIPQPVTGPNRSFGPASACPYRRTAVPRYPGIPVSRHLRSSPPCPPPRRGVYNEKSDRRSIAFRVELPRFELGITGPESVVLPLHHSSMSFSVMQK